MAPRKKLSPDILDQYEDELDELVDDLDMDEIAARLPPGFDPETFIKAILEYGDNAILLDEPMIEALCGKKAVQKGKQLFAAGGVIEHAFDGSVIAGSVNDLKVRANPWFNFDLSEYGCDCRDRLGTGCGHIAALMLAWTQDQSAFIPAKPTPATLAKLQQSPYGRFIAAVTGEPDFQHALVHIAKAASQPAHDTPAPGLSGVGRDNTSSGAAFWPVATSVRMSPPPMRETIEAEFNTAQLRELAKWLGVKLKGSAKSGYIEQVAAELTARMARMRETPEVLLEGLVDDHAEFVRRALTARDFELPLPRSLANALWTQQTGKGPDKRLTDLLEALRRRAILFPTRMYFGYRDVYYQWLSLSASGGNLPLVQWPQAAVKAKGDQPGQPASRSSINFLDAFELFLSALLSTGTEVRASLPAHPKYANTAWLKDWEHHADEATQLLNSRPGWVPTPQSGISVPLLSPLTPEAQARLEYQTGLPAAQCEFMFSIAAALQLVEAPDPLADSNKHKGAFKAIESDWRANPRASVIEEWFALTNEEKLLRAWNAWREQLFFVPEFERAAETGGFRVMRSIGARDFTPSDLAAEACALRRYIARALCGLPSGEWISWPDFRKLLFDFYPDCAWAIFSQDHWWFSLPGKPAKLNPTRPEEWQRTIGSIIQVMLTQPLRWFGVIDSDDMTDGKSVQTFRLTELHDWLVQVQPLAGTPEPSTLPALPASAAPRPRLAEPVRWLNDQQWHLPPAPDRAEFIAFARMIANPGDAPFTYALSPASIERALSQGITLEEVLRYFEKFNAPMPLQAQTLFRSIADRFGRVRVYESLAVLQLADDFALRELLANTALAQHIVYQISPRAVVVKETAIDGLVEEMIARGYTPGVL